MTEIPHTKAQTAAKAYFWPYDIFGYLLPGAALLVGSAVSNETALRVLKVLWEKKEIGNVLLLLGIGYVAGHLVSAIGSYAYEKLVLAKIMGYPTQHMLLESTANRFQRCARWLLRQASPGYFRAYSEEFKQEFKKSFEATFRLVAREEHDVFWMVWTFISYHHGIAFSRATHFLELAGLSRNISMSFLLLAFAPLVRGWNHSLDSSGWVWTCVISALLMFVNYTKLLRRLNDEIYRGFLIPTHLPPSART